MLVTLLDVVSKCPLQKWLEHTFTIPIDLNGETLVIRSRMKDMVGFKCTADMLRATPLLQNKPDNILDLAAKVVNQRILQLANEQAKLAELCAAMISDLDEKTVTLPILRIVGEAVFDILAAHEPHATLAGWRSWLKLCEAYVIQQ